MLIEFERFFRPDGDGEDDHAPIDEQTSHILINPVQVAAVLGSERHANATIIRMADGRGFAVVGNYRATADKLGLTQVH